MKLLNSKSTFILIFGLISVLLSGSIEYWLPEYSKMDQVFYRQMAEAAPSLNFNIPHFFAYRILPAWLAGILPGDVAKGFRILNYLILIAYSYSFYFLLMKLGLRESTSLFLTFILIFNRYFFQIQAWNYFQLSDLMSNTIIFLSLITLISGKYILLGSLFFIGIMCKETVLVIIPVSLVWFYQTRKSPKEYLKIIWFSAPAVFLFFLLRLVIHSSGNENLFLQIMEESYKYLSLNVWIKVLVIPFLPFSLLPIIFYKEFIDSMKSQLFLTTLFVFVVGTAILGYDFERLIAPTAPAFYFFVGIVYEKYFTAENVLAKIFTPAIYLLTLLNSFYHLWGIVKLADYTVTIYLSLLILITNSLIFIYIKCKLNSSSKSLA